MDEVRLKQLQSLDEKGLREKVLVPLLARMGFKAVTLYHGPAERGKDIICYREDILGDREYLAVVAKASDLTGNVSTDSGLREVFHQVQQCFDNPYQDLFGMKEIFIDRVWVITSGKIVTGAEESIFASAKKQNLSKLIRVLSGEKLVTVINQYYPDYWEASLENVDVLREQKARMMRFLRQMLLALNGAPSDIDATINQVINSTFPPEIIFPAARELSRLSPYRVELDKIDDAYANSFHSDACGLIRNTFFETKETLYRAMFDTDEIMENYEKVMKLTDPRKFVDLFEDLLSENYPFHNPHGRANDAIQHIGYLRDGLNDIDAFVANLKTLGKLDWATALVDSVQKLEPEIKYLLDHVKEDEFHLYWRINDGASPSVSLLPQKPENTDFSVFETKHTKAVSTYSWGYREKRSITVRDITNAVQVEVRAYLDSHFPAPKEN